MNQEDITITARCVKCQAVSKIAKPSESVSENIECQVCNIRTHASLWTQLYITEIDFESRNDSLEDEVLELAEENAKLKKGINNLQNGIDQVKEQLETLQKKTSKEDFLIQYVLNRANTKENMDGVISAKNGAQSWDIIQELCKQEPTDE